MNNRGHAVLVVIAIGMIWGAMATIFVQQVRSHKAPAPVVEKVAVVQPAEEVK